MAFDSKYSGAEVEEILDSVEEKQDKESGKGLSTNDYTTTEKDKLAGIEEGAQVNNTLVLTYGQTYTWAAVQAAILANKALFVYHASWKLFLPLNLYSANNATFKTINQATNSTTNEVTTTMYSVSFGGTWSQATSLLEAQGNRVSSITDSANNITYPTAKAVKDYVDTKIGEIETALSQI